MQKALGEVNRLGLSLSALACFHFDSLSANLGRLLTQIGNCDVDPVTEFKSVPRPLWAVRYPYAIQEIYVKLFLVLEGIAGIGPASLVWKTKALPLSYIPIATLTSDVARLFQ